jgi:hypothetical protein
MAQTLGGVPASGQAQTVKVLAPGEDGGGGLSAPAVPGHVVVAVVVSFVAAWIAAGSMGLIGHPLRHALTWVAMGVAIVAAFPGVGTAWVRAAGIVAASAIVIVTTPSIIPAVNVMGVAGAVAVLAILASGAGARVLRMAAASLAFFAVFRLAMQASPIVWSSADSLGSAMGAVAGTLTGRSLSVGVTFGGVDFLVLSGVFLAMWLVTAPAPRARRVLWAALGILAAQLAYLAVLSFVPAILADVPEPTKDAPNPEWAIPIPLFVDATLKLDAGTVRQWLPWRMPVLAAALHALVLIGAMRWGPWRAAAAEPATAPIRFVPWWRRARPLLAPALAALVLGFAAVFCTPADSLASNGKLVGKKIVVYNRVFGNYMKPKHGGPADYGHLSIGMYGNLVPFVESLGGRCVVTNTLSPDELRDADALLVIYPSRPYASKDLLQHIEPTDAAEPKPMFPLDLEQVLRFCDRFLHGSVIDTIEDAHVRRIWDYVEKGGTLMVLGEHTIADPNVPPQRGRNLFNHLLVPTNIRVNFDSATFEIGGWLQSYHPMFHPTTIGIEDSRNQFGVVIGASLDVKYPARPILVGRWGYNDPGDESAGASMMGNHKYDAGERLGDVILAAEQSYGRGHVFVFGDTSNMTNGITVGAHPFNARLLAYLTHAGEAGTAQGDSPISTGRQVVTILLMAALVAVIAWGASAATAPASVLAAMLCLAISLSFWTRVVSANAEIYPTASMVRSAPAKIAYIDNAHLGFYSEESWRPEGTMGLAMNLMRNGYLTYMAPDLSRERLITDDNRPRASLVVMPAPTRALSATEIETLQKWVRAGGALVMTIGWDRYGPNHELVRAFGFDVGSTSHPERPPEPLGHYKAPYWRAEDGSYQVYVRFHAAWWVRLLDPSETTTGDALGRPKARDLAYGRYNEPTILWRREGAGQVVLVGDSEFATNQNLEREGGEPFEGMRENADFWRWLCSYLEAPDDPAKWWKPPNPATQQKKDDAAAPAQPEPTPAPGAKPADVFELDSPKPKAQPQPQPKEGQQP